MSKFNTNVSSVYSLVSELKSAELKPVYFLFGEDYFTINSAIRAISNIAEPFLLSDFDRETISAGKKSSLTDIIDLAYTFPFGSEKKLLIVKNFENFNNKKQLLDYIKNPSVTTLLVLANYGKISNLNSEPYKTLTNKKQIFEARELKGAELENWVKKRCKQLKFKINTESLKTLVEIVGEDKSLLEMQLQKFKSFLGDKEEIFVDDIKKLSSATKEYSIFDLLNAIGKGNASNSIKIINNLLDCGKDMVFILSMLTKFFSVIAQSIELEQRKLSDKDASKAIGVSIYYYINCKNAKYFKNENRLLQAANVLYKTDLSLKTTNVGEKTLAAIMVTNFFLDKINNY